MVSAVAGVGDSNNILRKGKALAEKKFLKKGQGRAAVPLDKYKSKETAEAAAGAAGVSFFFLPASCLWIHICEGRAAVALDKYKSNETAEAAAGACFVQ